MPRTGSQALALLAAPINAAVLGALGEGPHTLPELRSHANAPPQTTLRDHLRGLVGRGVVERLSAPAFPGVVSYELTASGRDLLKVAGFLSRWLASAPGAEIQIAGAEAKNAISTLVDGWNSRIVRAIASAPCSLTDLDNLISTLNYPSLERRLTSLRRLGMVEPTPDRRRGRTYRPTGWLRHAVPALAAAAWWEQRHLSATAPQVTNRDLESALLLSLPLVRLSEEIQGSCRLAIRIAGPAIDDLVGVVVEVEGGRVVSSVTNLQGVVQAWALGSTRHWIEAIAKPDPTRLELGGDHALATELVDGLHLALLGVETPR